jgi:nucleotide-binding universal stress UspA family protein
MTANETIVVGADGSQASRSAVEYALQDAARRGAWLRAVAIAQLPDYWAGGYAMPTMPASEQIVEEMRAVAQQQLDEIRRTRPELAAVPVTVEARTGSPGPELVDAAKGAHLLVLGHRDRGAVRSALLGSVGLHCVLHATCPVAVVRPARVAERAASAEAIASTAQA